MKTILIFTIFSLLFILSFSQRSFQVQDLHDLSRIGEMSVLGEVVVYTARVWNQTTGVTSTNLKLNIGGVSVALTEDVGVSNFNPVVVSDSEILFLSNRDGIVNVYRIQLQGRHIEKVTDFPVSVNSFTYSKAGGYILLSIDVFPSCLTLLCTAEKDKVVSDRGENSWLEYDELFVRHWDKWEDHKMSQLFVFNLQKSPDTEPVNLMQGMSVNSPVPPFGGLEQVDISPDGKTVAFTGQAVDNSSAWTTGWNIYLVDVATQSSNIITEFTEARTQNPAFSPNGRTIAYLAMDRPGFEADRLHINLFNIETSKTTHLRNDIDLSFDSIVWDRSGEYVLVTANKNGSQPLFSIEILSGLFRTLIDSGTNSGLQSDGTDYFYLMQNSMNAPNDIYKFQFFNGDLSSDLEEITFENAELLDQYDMVNPISFQYTSSGHSKVQGWFLHPYGWKPEMSKSWPLVVLIHGGPEGAWNDGWSYRWNPQLWAGAGFATVMFNVHGSEGFGQDFTDAVAGNWGGVPFQDITSGIKFITDSYRWIEKDKISACGASYGGYMINWILGNEAPFKALVVHDGMQDTRMGYYTTDELWFPEWEFKGKPWVSPKNYNIWNPELLVPKWKTPTLVVHGGKDFRLPVSQGLATFTSLQRQGIPSELLYFPDENHWVLNPNNGIKWYNTVLAFLKKWST